MFWFLRGGLGAGGFGHVSGGCDKGDCLLGDGLQEMGCVSAMGVGKV